MSSINGTSNSFMADPNSLQQNLLSGPSRTATQSLFNQSTIGAVQDHERTREVLNELGEDGAALFKQATQVGNLVQKAHEEKLKHKGQPTIQKENTAVNLIFLCLTALFFTLMIIAEHSFGENFNQTGFCGDSGIQLWDDGFTECFVLLVLYCPVFLLAAFLAFISAVVIRPWNRTPYTGDRPASMKAWYKFKMICGGLYLIIALLRLILIVADASIFKPEETKGVDVTEDILQLVGIFIILLTFYTDYRSGNGTDYYIIVRRPDLCSTRSVDFGSSQRLSLEGNRAMFFVALYVDSTAHGLLWST